MAQLQEMLLDNCSEATIMLGLVILANMADFHCRYGYLTRREVASLANMANCYCLAEMAT